MAQKSVCLTSRRTHCLDISIDHLLAIGTSSAKLIQNMSFVVKYETEPQGRTSSEIRRIEHYRSGRTESSHTEMISIDGALAYVIGHIPRTMYSIDVSQTSSENGNIDFGSPVHNARLTRTSRYTSI